MFVTVAFGLGVDMRDIRCIVHIGLPNTLEEILFKKLKGVAEMGSLEMQLSASLCI